MWSTLVKDKELVDWSYAELVEEWEAGTRQEVQIGLTKAQAARLAEIERHMLSRPEAKSE